MLDTFDWTPSIAPPPASTRANGSGWLLLSFRPPGIALPHALVSVADDGGTVTASKKWEMNRRTIGKSYDLIRKICFNAV